MIRVKKISIIFLILMISLSAAAVAGPQDQIENLDFKNTDIVDVLRAIAEVADVNLITDSEISGNITVHLQDITFEKALDLITQTRAISYRWDQNTVVVASPERLDSIYDNIVTEFVEINSSDFDNIGTIVRELFPETQITLDPGRRQFILKGEEDKIAEIKEIVNRLDSSKTVEAIESEEQTLESEEKEIEVYSESYQVLNSDLEDLESKLSTVNSNLDYKTNPLTEIITISGEETLVKEAISMAETYDQSLEPETRNIRVDYVDTEQITEIVGKFYPEVSLHVNAKRKEIIINGAKNKLDGVADLIQEINKPQYQVVIETRVEEISSSFTRNLGIENLSDFSSIEFIKDLDGDITELDYTWPQFFKALDETEDSKTLANPRLMTLNGETATMNILDEEPYVTDIERNEDGILQYSYDYVEAGVTLEFTPWITENDEIEIEIVPEVSSFQIYDPQAQKPPSKKSRKVETKLRLNDGETIVIGGLIQTTNDGVITKIPLLGDIPLIGELFKNRNTNDNINELVIFVTPRIIKYGDNIKEEEHLISRGLQQNKNTNKNTNKIENKKENELEKSQEEIINEYLQERSKTRKEILESLKDNNKEKEYQELTPEELEEILND